jgi:hypothetical protein
MLFPPHRVFLSFYNLLPSSMHQNQNILSLYVCCSSEHKNGFNWHSRSCVPGETGHLHLMQNAVFRTLWMCPMLYFSSEPANHFVSWSHILVNFLETKEWREGREIENLLNSSLCLARPYIVETVIIRLRISRICFMEKVAKSVP